MKNGIIRFAAVSLLSLLGASAFAEPVSISSYDMSASRDNKYGYYSGTITQAGTYGYDYTGGSGTLNDGQIEHYYKDAYLFHYADQPTLTLHLGSLSSISFLDLFSFEGSGINTAVGSIAGLNVTINGQTRFITSEGFGPLNYNGTRNVHEHLSLIGSGLEDLITDTIILSGFVMDDAPVFTNGFYLSEIYIDGTSRAGGAVSEPAGLALAASSLAALGIVARRRKYASTRR